jgi:hypothetical protein
VYLEVRNLKANIQIGASILSLLALLTYTLVHTGGLLAQYVHPPFVGYVAAFGIEVAVVSLSLRIGDLRRSKQSTGFFLFVLVAVVVVSAVANIAEGFLAVQGQMLTMDTIRQLDPIQALIGLAATGLVSLIVLALAEIVGTDVETAVYQNERQRKRQANQSAVKSNHGIAQGASTTEQTGSIGRARAAKSEKDIRSKSAALDVLLIYLNENPDASLTAIGREIGRSKTTVANYLRELEGNGRLQRSSDGWQIR